ncbi:MAG: hypothetical protein RKE49_02200 [Oceanicaulis sp.]
MAVGGVGDDYGVQFGVPADDVVAAAENETGTAPQTAAPPTQPAN